MVSTLEARVVAVTGAGRGLGLTTVRVLLEHDAHVIAHYRSPAPDLHRLQNTYPDQLSLVAGDVGEEATAVSIADTATRLGRLDALVHNAAITRDQALLQMPLEAWDEVIRTNLRGAFLVTKHALRTMIRRRYGRLIYVSSLAAVTGSTGQANYAASKAGLHGLSQSVAQEYARFGIRSVVLAQGLLDTGLGAALPIDIQRRTTDHTLLGIGTGTAVAETVAFLSSPEADHINATVVHIDGGIRI